MKRQISHFGLVNKRTGELFDALVTPVRSRTGGKWMRLFQDTALMLSHQKLRGESYRVLFYLLGSSDFTNAVPGTKAVSEGLSMTASNVARAYRELKKGGYLLLKDKVYYLLPLLAWKGTDEQLQKRCQQLMKGLPKQLCQKSSGKT